MVNLLAMGCIEFHNLSSIREWNDTIITAFPDFSGRISCFGYDWLGRQFALDKERVINGQPQILMFESGTGEVYQIPCNFIDFHNEEIPNEHNACLASEFFSEWKSQKNICLTSDECAGYKVMLFLDGEDEVVNLEINIMDVYWHICSQLLQQLKDVPEGTVVHKIEFDN